jgi:hypothetical protein
LLREAIHEFFSQRAASSRRNLRQLFRNGRISLVIGLVFLATSIAIGDAVATYFRKSGWPEVLRKSFLIGGWIALRSTHQSALIRAMLPHEGDP